MAKSLDRELFLELSMSHQIIRRMFNVMTAEQRVQLAHGFDALGLSGEGLTRESERLALLEKASAILAPDLNPIFPIL